MLHRGIACQIAVTAYRNRIITGCQRYFALKVLPAELCKNSLYLIHSCQKWQVIFIEQYARGQLIKSGNMQGTYRNMPLVCGHYGISLIVISGKQDMLDRLQTGNIHQFVIEIGNMYFRSQLRSDQIFIFYKAIFQRRPLKNLLSSPTFLGQLLKRVKGNRRIKMLFNSVKDMGQHIFDIRVYRYLNIGAKSHILYLNRFDLTKIPVSYTHLRAH